MKFEYANDGFLPYGSFDSIYKERELPEFGAVESPYKRELTGWKFFLAKSESEIPFGFESRSFDDSEWDIINVPSTWQTEGYGLPQNLLYNYPEELDKIAKRGEESISDKLLLHSTDSDSDEVGIYRTSIVFSEEDIDRALYLEVSGICGSFNVYLNGQLQTESHSVMTHKRLLISNSAKPGVNQLAILVNRWDRDRNGKIKREIMNYGFSGIFRPVFVVAEPLLEISNLHIRLSNVPAAYVNQLTVDTASEKQSLAKVSRGDYLVKADFNIRNHTDYVMPYKINVSVVEARSEYDPYKMPYAKLNMQSAPGGTVDSHETIRDAAEFVALDVLQWSDATPVQYDLVLELTDSRGGVICAKKRRFGFRSTEIMMDKFHINDRPETLKLVRYFEFDPMSGITVPMETYRHDIMLMKRCGINGVIGQGFPLSDDFLNLCDQYGIYVIAESDMNLMHDYVESAMVHPSVIMWGMGSYGFDASKGGKIKAELKTIDDTRPWYVSKDTELKVTDMSPMPGDAGLVFGPWQDLCLDRKNLFDKNKTGNNIFDTVPGRTRFPDDTAEYKWIHHADLVGGKQKENSSIGQGIVSADREPHPIYLDIRKQCSDISIFASQDDPMHLTLRNLHPFAYTSDLVLEWRILLGGNPVMSGKGNIPEIEPYGTRTLKFPIDPNRYLSDGWANGTPELIEMYMNLLSHEIVFDISLKLANDTYYANEGFEIAFYQDVLSEECGNPVALSNDPMLGSGVEVKALPEGEVSNDGLTEVMADTSLVAVAPAESEINVTELINEYEVYALPGNITVGNDNMKIVFDRAKGTVGKIKIGESDFLMGGFLPSFYRCPSNIDRTDRSFVLAKTIFSKESDYEEIQKSLKFTGASYGVKNNVFSFISRYKSFAMKDEVILAYEIPAADTLRITLSFTPRYDMVRYGLRVPIVKDDMLCTWYGRGPGESYYDRKLATRLGLFTAGADKIYHPYARPSENSSHADTKTMQLYSGKGDILRFTRLPDRQGYDRFDFTVLPFTPEQMNEYLHEELLMRNDSCELFIDFCSKEIERTGNNVSSLPLRKNVAYKETFELKLIKG